MTNDSKPRRFRFSLRSLLVAVTLAAILIWWLRSNALQVRERQQFIAYLRQLQSEQDADKCWILRWDRGEERIPLVWRWMGATNEDWATWLICNSELSEEKLELAGRLLPDCEIEIPP